jgi:hypothetical protein
MSHNDKDVKGRIYGLFPSNYHLQDLQHQTSDGHRPLQDLVAIMEETLKILESNIEGLYENWFIETCNEWVAPYIGDLVDADLLPLAKGSAAVSGKAYVANTLHYRKRKGTVAILEEIARDVTGWDACVVEFFRFLSTTQNVNHVRLENECIPNIVNSELMEHIDTPFDAVPRMLDVRNIKNGSGFHNVANVGVFLWRLVAYPVRRAKAFSHGKGRYSFSSIGQDIPLFNHSSLDQTGNVLSKRVTVSAPIHRAAAKKFLSLYYGENKSMFIEVKNTAFEKIVADQIVICDLSNTNEDGDWNVPAEFNDLPAAESTGKVAIDPVLGRILFSDVEDVGREVFVSYYYGFSADIGGGFYRRDLYEIEGDNLQSYLLQISADNSISGISNVDDAITKWAGDNKKPAVAVIEIVDSNIYTVNISRIDIPQGKTLILRSAQEQRATLTAANKNDEENENVHVIEVSGGDGSCLVFDGLLINKNICFKVADQNSALKKFTLHHCTLVPLVVNTDDSLSSFVIDANADASIVVGNYWTRELQTKGDDVDANADASIIVEGNNYLTVSLSKSISGKICMKDSKGTLVLKDSIVDKGLDGVSVKCFEASLENSTVLGVSCFDILTLASNVFFADIARVKRCQEGCVRFSYIPRRFEEGKSASRMPRCYRCQPEKGHPNFVPRFTSEKYGSPGYAQLHRCNVKELFEGADNKSEIGAFNQIYQSQRVNNLLSTFAEYLPFGLTAGIILVI